MQNTYTKVDDHTLGVVMTKSAEVTDIVKYDYGFLKKQIIDIQFQKDTDNVKRDAELAEIATLIAEADNLGIVG